MLQGPEKATWFRPIGTKVLFVIYIYMIVRYKYICMYTFKLTYVYIYIYVYDRCHLYPSRSLPISLLDLFRGLVPQLVSFMLVLFLHSFRTAFTSCSRQVCCTHM